MTKPAFPPLGSDERYEIEAIYDRLFDGGYDLHIDYAGSVWVAMLHRVGLPGSSISARERGATALEAAKAIWHTYQRGLALNRVRADPALQKSRSDRYFF